MRIENKRARGIDNNSRLFVSFCPESAARLFFARAPRTGIGSPYRARYHFTHAVINSGPKIEIRAIINAGNLQGMQQPSYETEHPPLLIAPI